MKVAMDVSVSERATLALAKYDMTFDANPQGMQPTKMMPADISGGKLNTFVKPQPTNGIIENWKNTPKATAFGDFNTSWKSEICMVDPIPNMINWSNGIINILNFISPYPMNGVGNCNVKTTAATIHKVNEKPFNDSLVWVDRAINATPTIHKIPAKEESEKISPRIIMAAPEMDNNLKLFFIIGFAVFVRTDTRHFFKR